MGKQKAEIEKGGGGDREGGDGGEGGDEYRGCVGLFGGPLSSLGELPW